MPLTTGQTLNNRYRIVRLIGQGGFGAVYRAWDTAVNQPIALKENLDTSAEAQRQFQREATVMAGLRHPNLPRVTDHFLIAGQGQYLVMDFVEGNSLGQLLAERGRPFTEPDVLPWVEQVCDALHYLHTHTPPIIHRDIKPQNIIITPNGRAMLVDFGISKIYDPTLATTIGAKAVTPGYSPPEQYGTGATDARTDVYALGATLYALLTGQEPPDSVDVMIGNKTLRPPRQLGVQVSETMEGIILKAMNPTTGRRFQAITEMRGALQRPQPAPEPELAPEPEPISEPEFAPEPAAAPIAPTTPRAPAARSQWVWGALALLAVLVVVGLLMAGRGRRDARTTAVPTTQTGAATNPAMPIAENLRFMWEAGYKVTDLTYTGEQWAMALTQDSPYGAQLWRLQNDPPAAYLRENWDKGYSVTSLAYGGGQWAIVMSLGSPYGRQAWRLQNDPPGNYIREQWADGYSVTSLVYAAGQWGIVTSQGSPYGRQRWQLQNDPPGDYIRAQWVDGYSVTSLVYAAGQWGIVMSQGSPYGRQQWRLQNDPPDAYIAEMAAAGYALTSLVYADGQWGIVVAQGDVYGRQAWRLMGR